MSYQFIHFEDYSINRSKKRTNREEKKAKDAGVKVSDYNEETKGRNLREIIAEAKREPGNCPHVDNPSDPVLLYGVDLDTVEEMALNYHSKTKIKDKNGKEKKLRKDANVILAGVISLNRENENIWEDYKKSSIEYLKNKYGDKLKSVIEHTDESHPHFHFYIIQDVGENFDLVHDGKKAALEVRTLNKLKGEQNTAYIKAMRKYQEDFFLNVASNYGLTKDGPKRAKLSREDYLKQKQEIELLTELRKKTENELSLLKEKTDKEIKDLKEKSEIDIKKAKDDALALGRRIGRVEGFKSAIIDFRDNKNIFSKVIFSKTFSENMINQLQKKNNDLIDKNKKLFERKEHYKKDSIYKNKYIKEEKENSYLKTINSFLEEDIKNKEEMENDIRASIITEIKRVEAQQQQINNRNERNRQRNLRTGADIKSVKERFNRTSRMFFNHFKTFIRDIFSNSIFERAIERKEKISIEKIEYKKEESKNENRQDRKLNREGKKLKI
ncbi:plasmid recombination protein [Klebsiella quasipneumoniae]|uniref:plasmid recombination protein n=1 Tax=Klebsiella quasipneumoniae TaxID=1463165 RepID=UPI00388F4BAC|nr:hypothetical protein [Klebsiella quasipneumoniae]